MAPIVKMHTLGSDFIPEPIHAGGLRYHGMSPLVSLLKEHGHIEARSVHQRASFEAGVTFARAEGILPAPEPTHAIRVAIDEALAAKEAGEARVILFNLCGHGHFDLSAYERYLDGSLEDYEYPVEKVEPRSRPAVAVASVRSTQKVTGAMPRLACWSCGRQIYTVSPLESLFAEERRCPRCGAFLDDGAARRRAARDAPPPEPAGDPGPPAERRGERRGWPSGGARAGVGRLSGRPATATSAGPAQYRRRRSRAAR